MPRFDNITEITPNLDGSGLSIGIVMSRFNQDVCEGLLSAAVDELLNLGVSDEDILITTVPGALEIPLVLQTMADSEQFDALIAACGALDGATRADELIGLTVIPA